MALAYKALPSGPLLIATKPLSPRALRAAVMAFGHGAALPLALNFLETSLPYLFLTMSLALRPPAVFSFLPLKTCEKAIRPLANLRRPGIHGFHGLRGLHGLCARSFVASS
uniref:Uncharacterized protein n=1 Tax=Alexandrium monilatum TaxID=311494 RepID=A0A7S4SS83_9DINO